MSPLLPPPVESFLLGSVMADAIALTNMIMDYWLIVLGFGLGTSILILIFRQLKRAEGALL